MKYKNLDTMFVICMMACVFVSMPPAVQAQITESPGIAAVMSKWKSYNIEHQEIQGYRIQILATIDRRQMESVKRKFENLYPDYPLHVHHNDPYYHIKTGAFLTMQKAQAFMKKLQSDYPSAIPVTDKLEVKELLLYDQ